MLAKEAREAQEKLATAAAQLQTLKQKAEAAKENLDTAEAEAAAKAYIIAYDQTSLLHENAKATQEAFIKAKAAGPTKLRRRLLTPFEKTVAEVLLALQENSGELAA
jgi:hypothetical protein